MSNIFLGNPLDLNKYFSFQPTEEQLRALQKLIDFCEKEFNGERTKKIFMLHGYAGTGKTSLISALLNYFEDYNKQADERFRKESGTAEDEEYEGENQNPYRRKFYLLASTGRAAHILSRKTGSEVKTVHSAVYTFELEKVEEGKDSNKIRKIKFKVDTDNFYNDSRSIIIIDESSMLSDEQSMDENLEFGSGRLLTDLLHCFSKSRIIFVGDRVQLPPINTRLSIALYGTEFMKRFGYFPTECELKKIMRFDNSSIIYKNSLTLRESVLSNQKSVPSIQTDNIAVIRKPMDAFLSSYIREVKENINSNTYKNSSILICHSNAAVNYFNKEIRKELFILDNILNPREMFLVNQNNKLYNLSNGDIIRLKSISTFDEIRAGLRFRDAVFEYGEAPFSIEIQCKIIVDTVLSEKGRLTQQQEWKLYEDFHERINKKYNLILNKEEDIYQFLAFYQTDPYIQALRVRYGYAITCHKAQGGEWDNVYLIIEDTINIGGTDSSEFANRWLYTAITRARNKVIIMDNNKYQAPRDTSANIYNFKQGIFVPNDFSASVEVFAFKEWKSLKGTDMITFIGKEHNYLIPKFRCIFLNSNTIPRMPATAHFKDGELVGFNDERMLSSKEVIEWLKKHGKKQDS